MAQLVATKNDRERLPRFFILGLVIIVGLIGLISSTVSAATTSIDIKCTITAEGQQDEDKGKGDKVEVPVKDAVPSPKAGDSGIPAMYLYIIIGSLVIAIICLRFLILRKKGKSKDWEKRE